MSEPLYSKFGKYTLLKNINTGGMAEILLAVLMGVEGFEKLTAIKRILPHLSHNQEFISMFISEAKLAAQLTHQNITHIYDFGRIDESYYIAMEYVRGKNLRELVMQCRHSGAGLTIPLVLDIIEAVCLGLDYAHRKRGLDNKPFNLVHRDINPHNILVSYEGEVKLVDFGIAKAAMQSQETKVGVLKGKVSYMSPEQVSGQALDKRSDIFSLGIVLYELITGQRLFRGETEVDSLLMIRQAEIPSPSKINHLITQELERVILKALTKDRTARYQSAAELCADIQKVRSDFSSGEKVGLSVFMGRLFQETMFQENYDLAELLANIKGLDIDNTTSALGLPKAEGITHEVYPQMEWEVPKPPEIITEIFNVPPKKIKAHFGIAAFLKVIMVGLVLILIAGLFLRINGIPLTPFKVMLKANTVKLKTNLKINVLKLKAKLAALQKSQTGPSEPSQEAMIVSSQPASEAALLPSPQPGTIKLYADVAQAEIYVDGERQDLLTSSTDSVVIDHITPNQPHQLKIVRQGYTPWTTSLSIDPGKQKKLIVHLELAPVNLSISSTPPGALVILNRVFKGKITPAVLEGLRPHETYHVELRLPGYRKWGIKIAPKPGKNINLGRITLKPISN